MKFSFKLSSVCSDKLKLIFSCMNSKFFFHLTQCTFHQFIPGTDMPCGRNVIRSRVRIFTFTSFLKEYIITTLLIRTYNPDVYRCMQCAISMCNTAFFHLTCFISIFINHIKKFHRLSVECHILKHIRFIIHKL